MPRKVKIGKVLKKDGFTLKVEVEEIKTHPLYQKRYKTKKRFLASDKKEIGKEGDLVEIEETRPISRLKHFKVKRVIKDKK